MTKPGMLSVGAWAAALRIEYLAARDAAAASGSGSGGGGVGVSPEAAAASAALRRVVSRYLHAFSAAGSADARKSRDFFDLQVDEARVAMCVQRRRSGAPLSSVLCSPAPPRRHHRSRTPHSPPRAQANRRGARAHAVQIAEERELGALGVGALAAVLHL